MSERTEHSAIGNALNRVIVSGIGQADWAVAHGVAEFGVEVDEVILKQGIPTFGDRCIGELGGEARYPFEFVIVGGVGDEQFRQDKGLRTEGFTGKSRIVIIIPIRAVGRVKCNAAHDAKPVSVHRAKQYSGWGTAGGGRADGSGETRLAGMYRNRQ